MNLNVDKPVEDSTVYNFEDYDPLRAVFEEIGHLLLQCWFHLVFCNDFQVVP